MIKDLQYYMSLPYKIEIIPLPEILGGGFHADLPELGRYAIVGWGDSIMEAIEDMEIIKEVMLYEYLKSDVNIPEPEPVI